MTWTLLVAIWGAVTGTTGAVLAWANRRDAVWARRARALESREDVVALRDNLAESRSDPSRTAALTGTNAFRARIQVLEEAADRCPDRRTRTQLKAVTSSCLSLSNIASTGDGQPVNFNLTSAIDAALGSASTVLKRMTELDRRAPG